MAINALQHTKTHDVTHHLHFHRNGVFAVSNGFFHVYFLSATFLWLIELILLYQLLLVNYKMI